MLTYWEYWAFNQSEPKPGPSQKLKQLMVTYKVSSDILQRYYKLSLDGTSAQFLYDSIIMKMGEDFYIQQMRLFYFHIK